MNVEEFLSTQGLNEDKKLYELKKLLIEEVLYVGIYYKDKKNTHVNKALEHALKELNNHIRTLEDYYVVESKVETPNHYQGNKDVISFLEDFFSPNGYVESLVFNIVKYTTRLGRKDDEAKEVEKIRVYFTRMSNYIKTGDSLIG